MGCDMFRGGIWFDIGNRDRIFREGMFRSAHLVELWPIYAEGVWLWLRPGTRTVYSRLPGQRKQSCMCRSDLEGLQRQLALNQRF